MNIIIFLGFLVLIVLLEAITDVLTYNAWNRSSKSAGGWAHITQILMLLIAVLIGYWLKTIIDFTFYNIVILLLCASTFHLFFFDIFYNTLLGKITEGNTSFWDRLVIKFKINKIGIVWILIKGLLLFGSLVLLTNIIY